MKKFLNIIKWYFSHLNFPFVIVFAVIILGLDFLENQRFNWMLVFGIFVFICAAPIYGIHQANMKREQDKIREKAKEIEAQNKKDDVKEYLLGLDNTERAELLKEVMELSTAPHRKK